MNSSDLATKAADRQSETATEKRRGFDSVTFLSIYIYLLIFIPGALVFGPLGSAGGPGTVFGVVLLAGYLVMWMHPAFTLDKGRQPIRVAGVLFCCAIVASYVSLNRHTVSTLTEDGGDVGMIFTFSWLGVLLLAADSINTMDRLKILLRRIVIGVTAMAVLGIIQFFTGLNAAKYIQIPGLTEQVVFSDLLSRGGFNRPSATAAHPLEFAAVLAMCLPVAIHQARFAQPGLRLRRWLQVAVIAAALPLTVSRAAIFGLVIVFIVIVPTWPKLSRRYAYGIAAVSTSFMVLTIPGLFGTFSGLFSELGGSNSSIGSRTGAFAMAKPFISQHPWFGVGFNTFFPQTYFFTDDQYLGQLIGSGVVGFLALLGLFATGWFEARSARRSTLDAETRHLAQCLAASVAAGAVAFATFDALGFDIAAGMTFLLLGCVGATWRLAWPERRRNG